MKCISKCNYLKRMFSITILGILLFSVLTGCGQIQKYEIPYTADSEVSSFRVIEFTNEKNTAYLLFLCSCSLFHLPHSVSILLWGVSLLTAECTAEIGWIAVSYNLRNFID